MNPWNTIPVRLVNAAFSFRESFPGKRSVFPSRLISPESGVSNRFMHRSSVDLPEPEEPIIAVVFFDSISRLISFQYVVIPKILI